MLVSTDGGATYPNTATGTTSWSWDWTLPAEDYVAHTIMAKARDNTLIEDSTPASVAIHVDTVTPTGLSLSAPADTATGVSTSPSLQVNAATDGNPTIEYYIEVAEDNLFTVNAQNSGWQTATSWTPGVALSAGVVHYWRATARDGAGNTTATTATWTFTTAATCTYSDPTVSILTASKEITVDGGFVDYTVQVTNNDTAACADTTFSLSVSDSNSTNFYASVLTDTGLTIAPGASAQTTFRVTAQPNQPNASTNISDVNSAADANHGAVTSGTVTTTINVSGGGCIAAGDYLNTNGDQLLTERR